MHARTYAARQSIFRPPAAALLAALLCLPLAAVSLPSPVVAQPRAAITVQPCAAAGSATVARPAITFGRAGGNIRPMQVIIYTSGAVAYQGAAPASPTYAISPAAVVGLLRLAGTEGFWSMPSTMRNPEVLPDIASLYISLRSGCSTTYKTVHARGDGFASFSELYDTLTAAAGLGGSPAPVATPVPGTQSGPQTITLANNGQSLTYSVGQSVLLQLGYAYRWTISFADATLFRRQINVMMIRGAQGTYTAVAPGQTTLRASGIPACVQGQACSNLSRQFKVLLTVRAS